MCAWRMTLTLPGPPVPSTSSRVRPGHGWKSHPNLHAARHCGWLPMFTLCIAPTSPNNNHIKNEGSVLLHHQVTPNRQQPARSMDLPHHTDITMMPSPA
jgi:hypothetical protein